MDLMGSDSSQEAHPWECGSGFTVITHTELSTALCHSLDPIN